MILTTILEQTLNDTRLDAGEIYLLDENTGELNHAYHRGLSPECVEEAKGLPVKLGEGVTGHVAVQGETLVVPELLQEPRFLREMPKKEGYRTLISLPIRSGDRAYGVVNLFSKERQRFSARYVAWLAASMEMPGIAFDYIQLFQEREKAVQKLRFMFESIGDGIIATDLAGNITEVNNAALHLTGYSREELMGRNALELVSPKDRARAVADLAQVLDEGQAWDRVEYTLVAADGTKFDVELRAAPLRDSSGNVTGLIGVGRDITERKRMEKELIHLSNAVRMATDSIVISDLEANIIEVNEATLRMYGTDDKSDLVGKNALELIAPEDREKAIAGIKEVLEGGYNENKEYHIITKDGSIILVAMNTALMRDADGMPIGFVAVSRDITERKRAEQQIIQHSKELEALYDVAWAASQTLELDELLDDVLAKVIEVMEVDGGLIYLFLTQAEELVLKAHRGISEALAGNVARIKLQPEEIERIIQPKELTLSMNSVLSEAHSALFSGLRVGEGFRSHTAVPLQSKDVLHGVIAVISYSERRFTPDNTGLLHAIANQIAVAIENASLFQDTKDKAERLAVTAELTRILVSSLNIEEVFNAFTAGVRRLVDFDRAGIALVEGGNVRFLAVSSEVETGLGGGAIVPLEDTAAAWVVQNKRTHIEMDFAQSRQFRIDEVHFKSGLRSAIRLPLFYRGEVFGIFSLLNRHPHAYSQREVEILGELAGQIAIAIQNDKLFAEVKQRKEELETAYDQLMTTASALDRGKRELENAYLNMARTLVLTLEARDPYTRGHSERVAQISRQVAFEIGLSQEEVKNIETAARLHDLGKIGIPDSILLRPGPITPGERAEIQRHPTRAVELLRLLGFLDGVLPIVESHHERYNGGGYPESRRGEETPLGARILAVADAYDAMTSARPYRPPMSHEEAIKVLKEGAGKQWDHKVVETFLRTFGK